MPLGDMWEKAAAASDYLKHNPPKYSATVYLESLGSYGLSEPSFSVKDSSGWHT
jgi:hypothetical protein